MLSPGVSGSVPRMRRAFLLPAILVTLGAACGGSEAPPVAPAPAAPSAAAVPATAAPAASWIARSDENARVLVAVDVQFFPESATSLGVESADERTVDLAPGYRERHVAALKEAARTLEGRRAAERDPLVLGDLTILLREIDLSLREIELERSRPPCLYRDAARSVFYGTVQTLLDDQILPARRARAVARLAAQLRGPHAGLARRSPSWRRPTSPRRWRGPASSRRRASTWRSRSPRRRRCATASRSSS